ncbi:hypothetical protein DFH09DRAFT_1086676 [Mycena vulgaris]|nr:hypothetical protein DFH09DRAFT_1086676 [Mycena vulgaris]
MVYRQISDDLKERALWLLETGYITEGVCELLGVSRSGLLGGRRPEKKGGSRQALLKKEMLSLRSKLDGREKKSHSGNIFGNSCKSKLKEARNFSPANLATNLG